jgi:hypothetical protein
MSDATSTIWARALEQLAGEELAALDLDLLKQRKQALAQVEVEKLVEQLRALEAQEAERPEPAARTEAQAQPMKEKRGISWLAERVRIGGRPGL